MRTFLIFDLGETLINFNKSGLWYQSLRNDFIPLIYTDLMNSSSHFQSQHITLEHFADVVCPSIARQAPKEKHWKLEKRILSYLHQFQLSDSVEFVERHLEIFYSTVEPFVEIYSDTFSTIQKLSKLGYTMAILSNSPWQAPGFHGDRLLTKFSLLEFFPYRIYSGDVESFKPEPNILYQLFSISNETPENSIIIGDNIKDIEIANKFNIPGIWINRQKTSSIKLSAPFYAEISSLSELFSNLPLS